MIVPVPATPPVSGKGYFGYLTVENAALEKIRIFAVLCEV